jgi:hypothetical protein
MYNGCGYGSRRHGSDILLGAAIGYIIADSYQRGRGGGDLSGLFIFLVVFGLLTAPLRVGLLLIAIAAMLAACWVVFVALPAIVLGAVQVYAATAQRYPSTHTVALAVLLAACAQRHVWAAAMLTTPCLAGASVVWIDGHPRPGPRPAADRIEPRLSPPPRLAPPPRLLSGPLGG